MLDKYIVQPHLRSGVALVMTPSTSFVSDQQANERRELDVIAETLTPKQRKAIEIQAETLADHQKQTPHVHCLPTLTLYDIPVDQPRLDVEYRAASDIQFIPQTTNELTYIRMKFDISAVPEDLRWFIPLFSAMLGQLGTSKYKFDEIGTVLQTVSGGVSCSHLILPDTHDTSCYSEALVVETLCLPHHVSNTLTILEQLFADTQYTTPPNLAQIKSLVLSASAAANASIASTGHSLAAYRASMGLTSYAPAVESARGMTSIAALQQWADAIEADPAALDALGAIFRRLAALTFRRDQMGLSVVTEPHLVTQVDAELAKMTWQHHKQDDLAGRLGEGVFTMSSYFDPHTCQTLDAYADAVEFAVGGHFTDEDVHQALLATFSSIDAPQAPSAKGKGLFTRGFTHDMLQARRSQLLGVTKADLVRVATDHLANAAKSHAVVVGKEESRQELVHRGFQ
ncbi:hypothetical protein DYB34_010902 [Aphanomyces astaci]|uniref:Peptidase M16C associated domain-containing protein n=1 Tax=Aphanomyces astaci TaxID=112090 RepID=A0A3R6ZGX9_APHAT|nr:hypothetical protein DYB34_010902 [Aphanomyces astaci]